MTTREKIYHRALELFNERGIEHVGFRELSQDLGISPGNLGYYFPKKEDIIFDIIKNLREVNNATIVPISYEALDLNSFLKSLAQAFHNHLQFRALFLSFVYLMQQHPEFAQQYRQTQKFRNETIASNLQLLIKKNILKRSTTKADIEAILSYINLTARFWIADATIVRVEQSDEANLKYYLRLVAMLFKPHVTAKGKIQLDGFLGEL